jgi:uncharacterized repeat protein (TIGR03803 family)
MIYKLDAAGTFTGLYNFRDFGPTRPEGNLIQDPSGNLYGTTEYVGGSGLGAVYKLDTAGDFTVLYQFPGAESNTSRGYPNAGVIRDPEGNLYGTTPYGGVAGMIYKLNAAGQETTLYSFSGAPGGTRPIAGLTLGPGGSFYGTTQLGGAADWGVVYRVDAAGHETEVYSFTGGADGAFPEASVALDGEGNVYGTTLKGGSADGIAGFGVVYRIDPAGQETVLYTFTGGTDGGFPEGVIIDSAGNLYGTTSGGGAAESGVVFELSPAGTYRVLYRFSGGADGGSPGAGVIRDSAGNLYGTTMFGGAAGLGVIFKVSPQGQETVLYSFPGGPDGATPFAGVVSDSAGNLYGTTVDGGGTFGEGGSGVVYELGAAGTYSVLYRFTGGADGSGPFAGVIRDSAGNLYGTTSAAGTTDCGGSGCGVVYKVSPSGQETVLYSFTGGSDGATPYAGLVTDLAGRLYGTTAWGGKGGTGATFSGAGVVYEIKPR